MNVIDARGDGSVGFYRPGLVFMHHGPFSIQKYCGAAK